MIGAHRRARLHFDGRACWLSPNRRLRIVLLAPGANLTLIARYPAELRERAVAAVDRRRLRNPRDRTVYREISQEFGVGEQSLRLWVKHHDAERLSARAPQANGGQIAPQANVPDPLAAALTAAGNHAPMLERELDTMRRQLQKLQAENDVLKRAFVMFSAEWSKDPPSQE